MYIKIMIYMKILKQSTHTVDCVMYLWKHATCILLYMFSFTYEILAYLCKFIKLFFAYSGLLSFNASFYYAELVFRVSMQYFACQMHLNEIHFKFIIFRCYMRHIYDIHIMQQSAKLPTINVSWEFNDFFPCPLIVTLIDLPLELCIWGTT